MTWTRIVQVQVQDQVYVHVERARKYIAKIERAGALENIQAILEAADGIMVARGDLGMEIPVERIAVVQKDLIAMAKSQPGKVSYASSGTGGILHLAAELLCVLGGTQMTHMPFKATTVAIADLIAGRVQLMADNINSIGPHVKAGRLRGLAVTSAKRVPAFAELPTMAEAGVPGFDVAAWAGMIVPAGTPKAIIGTGTGRTAEPAPKL